MARFGIGMRLGVGFGVGVLFTMIVGTVGMYSNKALNSFTDDLYDHPYVVTNALRAANGDIIETRGVVKDLVTLTDTRQLPPLISQVVIHDRDAQARFAIIKERYLGPPEDVDHVIKDFADLQDIRQTIIARAQAGDFAAARVLSRDAAAPKYATLRADMDKIMAFAEDKAASFRGEAFRLRDRIHALTLMTLIGAVAVGFASALLTIRSITRPLRALQRSMAALSAGDLGVAIPGIPRRDEIGRMASAVQVFKDGLVHAGKLEQALRQAQKMEAIGQLTGGIAHDFNNLLQVIVADIELSLLQVEDGSAVAAYLRDALSEVERGAKLTGHLLAFARRQPLSPKPLRIDRLVADTASMLRRTLGERVEIEVVNGGGLWTALIDANQLQNAILNLAVNARDAMPDGGKLTFELANTALDATYAAQHIEVTAGQYVMLAITDTGHGMTDEVLHRAFEPFFTTKPEGAGTGLGLSMVFGFVKQSGGHIKIYSEVGLGTTIKLYLPRASAAELAQEDVETGAVCGTGETILVAEDDIGVRTSVVAQLAELGYRVLAAANGDEAIGILSRGEKVDLLFTDVVMPGTLNGRALAAKAMAIAPGLRVVFTSGYTENAIIHNGRLDEGITLLSKPYRLAQLADTMRAALAKQVALAEPPKPC